MSTNKVVYSAEANRFSLIQISPWHIVRYMYRHRLLIKSLTVHDFKAAYQASYLGLTWQMLLPLIMLSIYYFVFGVILGGRFLNDGVERPLEYALALFVGLGFFNTFSQNLNSSSSLIISNANYVKNLSFPLEILPLVSVINSMINLLIILGLTLVSLLLFDGQLYYSAILTPLYIAQLFLMALGVSYGLSALAVFIRDVAPAMTPISITLMFLCPIFYPLSMVPKKMLWIIKWNPLAMIIENARGSILYGIWPELFSFSIVSILSILIGVLGYYFFMRAKPAFADVI